MTDSIVVLITAPNEEDAAKIAHELVASRLAACVNIVRHVRSIYRWQGRVEDEQEVLMVAKTQQANFPELEQKVREMHSYTVPEIIALPIVRGFSEYLDWIAGETSQ